MTDPAATKTVLIVDDDETLRNALTLAVERAGFRVFAVGEGGAALTILNFEKVDLVLSDIRMPGMDGVALMKAAQALHAGLPFVLMTGFAEIIETQEAYRQGAQGFLAKPFEQSELVKMLRGVFGGPGPTIGDEPEEEAGFCRLSIDDFLSGRQIKFNIFIRLTENKYIKIAHRGEDLSLERIRAYRSRNLRHLHLRKKDFRTYVGFSLALTSAAVDSDVIGREKKLNLVKHTGEILLERIQHENVDQDAYDQSSTFIEASVAILADEPSVVEVLDRLRSHADHLYAHGVGVSLYAIMIARAVGWTLPANLFKVAMAGLLHDVGEKEIDKEQLGKPRGVWSQTEIKAYESHSMRGAEILSELPSAPGDLAQIVLEHHENCQGTGFPSHLRRASIHPMARLLAVADEFCVRIIASPYNPGMTPREALLQIQQICGDRLDPDFVGALRRLVSVGEGKDR